MCEGHVSHAQVVELPECGQTAVYGVTSFQTNQTAYLAPFKGFFNSIGWSYKFKCIWVEGDEAVDDVTLVQADTHGVRVLCAAGHVARPELKQE